ncbi:MAG: HEAT repeat domain-containing protein, partial [Gemmatimonadetes bacterium]|nr:HEAT repeat domain-containing protein [Gemmatimonadota bacterium]
DLLWKTALLGGLLTATLQAGIGYAPVAGRLALGAPARPAPTSANGEDARAEAPRAEAAAAAERTPAAAPRDVAPPVAPRPRPAGEGHDVPWLPLLLGAWAVGAGLLLVRLAVQHARLFRALAGRRPLDEGPLAGMLAELRRNAGLWTPVRLSASAACPTPIAIGRAEICVPERFLTDLDPDQQRGALAHELAHLRRADPLWQLAAGVVEAVFFFQPLNRVGRLRWREAAENLCDDWAVQSTGSPLGLARCLTHVASWIGPARVPEVMAAMAEGGSPLLRRVERLAEWRPAPSRAPWLRPVAAAALLAGVAATAPAVTQRALAAAPPVVQAAALRPVGPDTVLLPPDPSAPLAARWAWARASAPRREHWVAWGVRGPSRAEYPGGSFPVSSSAPHRGNEAPGAPTLRQALARSGGTGADVAFVFGMDGEGRGEVRRVRLRSADAPLSLEGRPLLWLGTAGAGESLARLDTLEAAAGDPALRAEIAAAHALHADPGEVVRSVAALLRAEGDPEVRAEAVQWLPRVHPESDEVAAALLEVAFRDPAESVQMEAVDALARSRAPSASRALVRIAETHPRWAARSEAAQTLARRERRR